MARIPPVEMGSPASSDMSRGRHWVVMIGALQNVLVGVDNESFRFRFSLYLYPHIESRQPSNNLDKVSYNKVSRIPSWQGSECSRVLRRFMPPCTLWLHAIKRGPPLAQPGSRPSFTGISGSITTLLSALVVLRGIQLDRD